MRNAKGKKKEGKKNSSYPLINLILRLFENLHLEKNKRVRERERERERERREQAEKATTRRKMPEQQRSREGREEEGETETRRGRSKGWRERKREAGHRGQINTHGQPRSNAWNTLFITYRRVRCFLSTPTLLHKHLSGCVVSLYLHAAWKRPRGG